MRVTRSFVASMWRSFGASRIFVAERFIRPVQEFMTTEAFGGLALLAAALAALTWANSPWQASYTDFWSSEFHFSSELFSLHMDLHEVVNDGLMSIFFFVVGLEIKRELLHGELATLRKAALPVFAALGGMVVPAVIYAAVNAGGDGAKGWAIPMATDIAFALGALALLGRRVPFSLKVFLLALAIVDDLGAIAVIAVFYTGEISWVPLAWAASTLAGILLMGRARVRSVDLYVVAGLVLWLAVFKSGLHATLAGIALAALTPSRPLLSQKGFESSALDLVLRHRRARDAGDEEAKANAVEQLERLSRDTEAPLNRLEHTLHPWTSFAIVPIFALANAGVMLSSSLLSEAVRSEVTIGIVLGLLLGKPVGILAFSWLAVRLRAAALPDNMSFVHVLGAGLLGGIGFTVALFVTGLAFTQELLVDEAKVGIVAGSLVAGVIGFVCLWVAPGEPETSPEAADPL